MFREIEEKSAAISAKKEEIESIKRMLQEKQSLLSKEECELKVLSERISIENFLEGSEVNYVRIGEATRSDSEAKEVYGFVYAEHVAFLMWESYVTGNDGKLYLEKSGISHKMQSVCMCGCGLNAKREEKSSYKIEEIKEDAEICKGFMAKPMIEKCIEKANELGISVIFSRHADYLLNIGGIHFREICIFRRYIPLIGKKVADKFFQGGIKVSQ